MKQAHVIGRQKIELMLSPEADAFRLQQTISRHYMDIVVPALQRLFDELCPKNDLIRIDCLEIDLGILTEYQLDNEGFEKQLIAQLRKEISRLVPGKSKGVSRELVSLSHFSQWLYFLESGCLPWQTQLPEKEWLNDVLETLGLESEAVEKLHHTIKNSLFALERLVLQNKDTFLCSLAELYTSYPHKELAPAVEEIYLLAQKLKQVSPLLEEDKQQSKPTALFFLNKTELRLSFWKDVFQQLIVHRQMHPWYILVFRFMTKQQNAGNPYIRALKQLKKAEKEKFDFLLQSIRQASPELYKDITEGPEASAGTDVEALKPAPKNDPEKKAERLDKQQSVPLQGREAGESGGMESGRKSLKETEDPALGTGIEEIPMPPLKEPKEGAEYYLRHAGLVLLHPFLSHFFKNLDLTADGKFKDRGCIDKGIHLAHYLASGETKIPEYELLLPKLLLGVPFEVPVEKELNLSQEELEEGESLLRVAVEHWGALGKTSPDGLREGFLQREGKLSKIQNGWRLQVEQKTIDVLLDRLKWNISMLKLPWMKEMLWVEWR